MKAEALQRKAYRTLVIATTVLVGVLGTVRTIVTPHLQEVQTVTVSTQTVTETVVCTGTVQASEGVEVTASVPCVVGDVIAEEGDAVKQGDVLLTVDRSATLSKAVSAGLPADESAMVSASLPEVITAPKDGVVSAVNAAVGDMLSTDSPCVVLSEKGDVQIAVAFRESMLPRLREGQAVTVSGVAFDKDSYDGTLTHIASSARSRVGGTTTETVVDGVVTLRADCIDESLLVGLTAKVTVTVDTREDVRVIPYESVCMEDNGQPAVYVVSGTLAYRTPVTTGKELASGIEITNGITVGQRIVRDATTLTGDVAAVEVTA